MIDWSTERGLFVGCNCASLLLTAIQGMPLFHSRNAHRWKFPRRLTSSAICTLMALHGTLLAGAVTNLERWCVVESVVLNILLNVLSFGWMMYAALLYAIVVKERPIAELAGLETRVVLSCLFVSVACTAVAANAHGSNSNHPLYCWIDEDEVFLGFVALYGGMTLSSFVGGLLVTQSLIRISKVRSRQRKNNACEDIDKGERAAHSTLLGNQTIRCEGSKASTTNSPTETRAKRAQSLSSNASASSALFTFRHRRRDVNRVARQQQSPLVNHLKQWTRRLICQGVGFAVIVVCAIVRAAAPGASDGRWLSVLPQFAVATFGAIGAMTFGDLLSGWEAVCPSACLLFGGDGSQDGYYDRVGRCSDEAAAWDSPSHSAGLPTSVGSVNSINSEV